MKTVIKIQAYPSPDGKGIRGMVAINQQNPRLKEILEGLAATDPSVTAIVCEEGASTYAFVDDPGTWEERMSAFAKDFGENQPFFPVSVKPVINVEHDGTGPNPFFKASIEHDVGIEQLLDELGDPFAKDEPEATRDEFEERAWEAPLPVPRKKERTALEPHYEWRSRIDIYLADLSLARRYMKASVDDIAEAFKELKDDKDARTEILTEIRRLAGEFAAQTKAAILAAKAKG